MDNPFAQFGDPDDAGGSAPSAPPPPPSDDNGQQAPQLSAGNPFADHEDQPTSQLSEGNPFADYEDHGDTQPKVSGPEAAAIGAEKGALGVPGWIAGARIGAGVGALGGPMDWLTIPAGTIAGGLIGAGLTTEAGNAIQNKILGALGINYDKYQQAAQQQHKYLEETGELVPQVGAFGLGTASKAARAIGATIFGGVDAAQQYMNNGEIDPTSVLINAGAGALMTNPSKIAEDTLAPYEKFLDKWGVPRMPGTENVPGRPDLKAGEQEGAQAQADKSATSEDVPNTVNTNVNTLANAPSAAPPADIKVDDAQNGAVGSAREYEKGTTVDADTVPPEQNKFKSDTPFGHFRTNKQVYQPTTGPVDPAVAAAISGENAAEAPAAPQEPAPPQAQPDAQPAAQSNFKSDTPFGHFRTDKQVQPDAQLAAQTATVAPAREQTATIPAAPPAAAPVQEQPAPNRNIESAPGMIYQHPDYPELRVDHTRKVRFPVASNSKGSTVFINNTVPKTVMVGAGEEAKALNPALPLAVGERGRVIAQRIMEGENVPADKIPELAKQAGDAAEQDWLAKNGYDAHAYGQLKANGFKQPQAEAAAAPSAEAAAPAATQAAPKAAPKGNSVLKGIMKDINSGKLTPVGEPGSPEFQTWLKQEYDRRQPAPAPAADVTAAVTNPGEIDPERRLTAIKMAQARKMPEVVKRLQGPDVTAEQIEKVIGALHNTRTRNRPQVADLGVSERIPEAAAAKTKAVLAARQAMKEFGDPDPQMPKTPEDKAALRQRLEAGIQRAAELNDGKPNTYRSKDPSSKWLAGARKLIQKMDNDNATNKDLLDFLGDEQLNFKNSTGLVKSKDAIEGGGGGGGAQYLPDMLTKSPEEELQAKQEEAFGPGTEGYYESGAHMEEQPEYPITDDQRKALLEAGYHPNDIEAMDGEEAGMELKKVAQEEAMAKGTNPEPIKSFADLGKAFGKNQSGAGIPLNPAEIANRMVPRMVRNILSPTSVSKMAEDAASLIREKGGMAARALAIATDRIEKGRAAVNAASEADRIDMMKYLDTGQGKILPTLKPIADAMRKQFKQLRAEMEKMPSFAKVQFLSEFFPHMWTNPLKGAEFVADAVKQGSASSTKNRSFVTLEDGLKAGLKLASTDPVDVYLRYMSSMRNFVRTQQILEDAVNKGIVKEYQGTQAGGASGNPHPASIPFGYAEIKGRSIRPFQKLYAPEDWARVYNNFVDPGWRSKLDSARLYDALQMGSNAVTSLELSFSAYHAVTMTGEAFLNEIARGISQLAGGKFGAGLKTLGASPAAPYRLVKRGSLAQDLYLDKVQNASPELKEAVNYITRAGGRLIGRSHDPQYQYSRLGSLFTSWRRGAIQMELQDAKNRIFSEPGLPKQTLAATREAFSMVGRVMQTAAQPLFEQYIPRLKAGAALENFVTWRQANPTANDAEALAAARRIVDSVDNRFGEMINDNVFMPAALKQAAQVGMRSWSWNLGTIREIAGGVLSAIRNPSRLSIGSKDYDPRIAYALAMPIGVSLMSTMYQFLKTGQMPGDVSDLVAPRTGGRNLLGTAERALVPGYEKDVLGYFNNPSREAINKVATAPRLIWEVLGNQDYRGDIISDPNHPLNQRLQEYAGHVFNSLGPISFKQIAQGSPKGSNITLPERMLAIRQAPSWLQNPAAIRGYEYAHNERAERTKLAHQAKDKALNR